MGWKIKGVPEPYQMNMDDVICMVQRHLDGKCEKGMEQDIKLEFPITRFVHLQQKQPDMTFMGRHLAEVRMIMLFPPSFSSELFEISYHMTLVTKHKNCTKLRHLPMPVTGIRQFNFKKKRRVKVAFDTHMSTSSKYSFDLYMEEHKN